MNEIEMFKLLLTAGGNWAVVIVGVYGWFKMKAFVTAKMHELDIRLVEIETVMKTDKNMAYKNNGAQPYKQECAPSLKAKG